MSSSSISDIFSAKSPVIKLPYTGESNSSGNFVFEFTKPWVIHFSVSEESVAECWAEFFNADGSKVLTPMHRHPNSATAMLGLVRNMLHFELEQKNARDDRARGETNE